MEQDEKYVVADISTDSIHKISALEQELSADNKEDVVLIAYTNKEPRKE